jgi:hypothetical protein
MEWECLLLRVNAAADEPGVRIGLLYVGGF